MRELAGAWSEDLVQALPALQALLGPARSRLPEKLAQSRLLQAMYALLGSWASARQPFLLLLDDVQGADPNSLELLAMLGRGGTPANLLVVAACRSEEVLNPMKRPSAEMAGQSHVELAGPFGPVLAKSTAPVSISLT